MKIKINKDALNKSLNVLQPGIPSNPIVAVEGMMLFTFEGDSCTIRISNTRVEMTSYVTAEFEEDTEFCVPAHIMGRTVANFPDGEIQIEPEVNEEIGAITSIRLKPEGQRKKYKIACHPIEDFAKWNVDILPEVEFTIDMKEFSEKMRIAANNVNPKDLRMAFSNINFFSSHGKLAFISGDNVRVGMQKVDIDFSGGRIVPKELGRYLSGVTESGPCTVKMDSNKMSIEYSGMTLVCSTINDKQANYQLLFDMEPEDKFEVLREDVIAAMSRISVFSDEKNRLNLQTKENKMRFFVRHNDNEAEEELDIVNPHKIELNVNMNLKLLKDSLINVKAETVTICQGDKNVAGSIFIRPKDNDNELWMFGPYAK